MLIFSYVDVQYRALTILKRLNSAGYDMYRRSSKYNHYFEIYLKTQSACANIKMFNDEEILSGELNKALKLYYSKDSDTYEKLKVTACQCDKEFQQRIS